MAPTNAHPKKTATKTPSTEPRPAITTASDRTIDRSWLRAIPTARNNPSSRVRSWIDRASVFTIPRRAMTTDRASSAVTGTSSLLICSSWAAKTCSRSRTSTLGKSTNASSIARRPASGVIPAFNFTSTSRLNCCLKLDRNAPSEIT